MRFIKMIEKPTYEELAQRVKELEQSEEKYRLLVENANDAIFILQDGKIKFFNKIMIR